MKIAMIGTGYVGLVSGTCFAEFGISVTCVDKDDEKIARLERGEIPIYEPGLEDLVTRQVKSGRLEFTRDLESAVAQADAVFIAVGTPTSRFGRRADLSYVYAAAREVAACMNGYTLVVTKSTVPVGTAREIENIIKAEAPGAEFDVCSNPEFLREGSAIEDFLRPDRVVIGVESDRAREVMRRLYRPLYINETPIVMTDCETAEIIKYASNAFLATKITFINEVADLCEKAGGNVQDVARAMGLDGRIGPKFLHAGPGYGGSCFPKDTQALTEIGLEYGAPQTIVENVVTANENRQKQMAGKITQACGGSVEGLEIGILGVSFKPNTDDMREAPSLVIIPALQEAGAKIRAFDPAAMEEAARKLDHVSWCDDPYDVAAGAHALVILTEWNEFRALDLERVETEMATPRLIDLRNIYKRDDMHARGFDYISIGRPGINGQHSKPGLREINAGQAGSG